MILSNNIEQKKTNDEFIKKMKLCKDNSSSYSFNLIKNYIVNNVPLIEIVEKYLNTYRDLEYNYESGQRSVCYELFEAFYMYKNNMPINYKLARYLKYSMGILSSGYYFDNKYKFVMIFISVKDIIKEFDGIGFNVWLNDMCEYRFSNR